jgi:hypothetical protein
MKNEFWIRCFLQVSENILRENEMESLPHARMID